MKYYLIAGEASGDLHASNLMRMLKSIDADADFRFYGGEKMEEIGGTLVKHYRETAYMGFVPVLLHLPAILRNMRQCKADIVSWQPDVLILVDYPGFNLNIAKYIHANTHIPVYYYIAPKIWAWKEYRIKAIRRDIDQLYSILPFEVDFFEKKHKYPVHYVGNPCVDAIAQYRSKLAGADVSAVSSQASVALLPGSRRQEIKDNLTIMLKAVAQLGDYRLVLAAAPNIEQSYYEKFIPHGVNVEIVYDHTYEVLQHSVAALVTSGTATLETALLGVPQVVCYYAPFGWAVRLLRKWFLKVRYISLVNLIAGREVVCELVADDMNVARLTSELRAILPDGDKRSHVLSGYEEMSRKLGPAGASERAAALIVQSLKKE